MTKRSKRPKPITKTPASMRSRKKARHITTAFHRLTSERDKAVKNGQLNIAAQCEQKLDSIGGVRAYQQASQLSTSFHSTSKWVLSHLSKCGWLHGVAEATSGAAIAKTDKAISANQETQATQTHRRTTKLLEVGAINTELLSFANKSGDDMKKLRGQEGRRGESVNLHVRAIDIHAMHADIEEINFLDLPFISESPSERYDVIVCSMVINCVTCPADRGKMLARLFHHLRPGGLCFLTLPKSCLSRSEHLNHDLFCKLLGDTGAGFILNSKRETEKVSFFICQRPDRSREKPLDSKWTVSTKLGRHKRCANSFAVTFAEDEISGCVKPGQC